MLLNDLRPDALLLDANSVGYAAMYVPAFSRLAHQGFSTGGIHGTMISLLARMRARPGATPFVLWDCKAEWRHNEWPGYKSNRSDTPEKVAIRQSYKLQTPVIRMFLSALGIPQVSCGLSEADDLAGHICRNMDTSWIIEFVTRDTDYWQSLADNVVWYSPIHKKQVTLADLSNPATEMLKTSGHFLSTFEYLQAKALSGDDSDCIPGVEGVGMKTATKIARTYGGSMEAFWAGVDDGSIKPKGVVAERVATHESRDIFYRNLRLMDWSKAPEIRRDLLSISYGKPNWDEAEGIANEYGLSKVLTDAKSLLNGLNGDWGCVSDAVYASLHSDLCQPVLKAN